jgi:4-hydroxy-tetrahydrodipicolinate reductase
MSQTIRILLNGAKGRMGLAIIHVAPEESAVIAGAVDQGDNAAGLIGQADVVIDFSSPHATLAVAQLCAQNKKPLVIGTTGHTAEEKAAITKAIKDLPVVWAGNYSVGVTLLNALVRQAARALSQAGRWDIEVTEMHHRHKKDAPSGTADTLLKILLEERKLAADALKHGRSGLTGERPLNEIGVHALRGGDVVGDHTVLFAAEGERLELTHKAANREIFARGALRAARWVKGKSAGIYGMDDVLGLR